MPPSTTQILAEKALDMECGQACVDWAIGLVEAGCDSDTVVMLAGMTAPLNHFEVATMRNRALTALGIRDMPKDQAIRAWAAEHLRRAWDDPASIRQSLRVVSDLCVRNDYHADLVDFYLLQCAWDDLDDVGHAHHWQGATADTIDDIVRTRIRRFLGETATQV